jgi:hypothetical protein
MRCSKCHNRLGWFTKFCPKCGQAVSASKPAAAGKPALENQPKKKSRTGLIVKLVLAMAAIAGLIGGLHAMNLFLGLDSLEKQSALIQDSLAEAAAAKNIGDQLAAKKKNLPKDHTWKNVETRAAAIASLIPGLSTYSRLDDYKKVATIWAVKIREAAKDNKTWEDVSADPGDFKIGLRPKEAEKMVKNSLVKIAEVRQFGDYAVAQKDREAMRFVAAKLLVQKHWLDGLSHCQPAGIFAQLISPAYAYAVGGKKICFTAWNGKPFCSFEVQEMTTEMYNAANDIIEEKIGAADNWYKASAEIHAKLEAEGMPVETLGGVASADDKIANQEPVLLTNFKDACLGRGGIIGGANQITDGLPTTERGTYCGYKNQADNCWNFMTSSGGYYAGGDVGCVRIGLTPAELAFYLGGTGPAAEVQPEVPPAPAAPVKTAAPKTQPLPVPLSPGVPEPTEALPPPITPPITTVAPEAGVSQDNTHPYDGNYYVSETYNCNISDGSSRSTNTSYSITVKDGLATTNLDWGKNSAAISGNSAQIAGQSSDSYYRYNYTINLNFSQSPNGTWVSGTRNWSQSWIGYSGGLSGNCQGSFKGSGN